MSVPETLPPTPQPAPSARRILAHGMYETRNTLRNGEQLLVSLILPLLVLYGVHRLELISGNTTPGIDVVTPGVLALAIMASAFTGQGIATGFERQYGVLAYLSTTPLGPTGLILGKVLAVLCVAAVQIVVIGTAGIVLGWSPDPLGLVWLLCTTIMGVAAFTALGLLIAGTVRAEATLAVTNVTWVLMGAAGGAVFPLNLDGNGALLILLPSAALGEAARTSTIDGSFPWVPLIVLLVWAAAAVLAARRWFTWR